MPHLSNVYRCCPLPNLCQTNKPHSVQSVNKFSFFVDCRPIKPKGCCMLEKWRSLPTINVTVEDVCVNVLWQLPAVFMVAFSMCIISVLIPDGNCLSLHHFYNSPSYFVKTLLVVMLSRESFYSSSICQFSYRILLDFCEFYLVCNG